MNLEIVGDGDGGMAIAGASVNKAAPAPTGLVLGASMGGAKRMR